MHAIYFHEKIEKDLAGVGREELHLLRKMIDEKLAVDPLLFGKPLRESLKNYRSLRVGKYRIVSRVTKDSVYTLAIGHRQDTYEKAFGRSKT